MKIVISGVNLVEGGPLKVFKDAILAFNELGLETICLVNNKQLFRELSVENVTYIEYPSIKSSWLNRLYFEYIECLKISLSLKPDIWLSMHDTTPRLKNVMHQFVYCHNPSPFYKASVNDCKYDFKFVLFTLFYKWLYKFNIKSNTAVITQQSWIAEYFEKTMGVKRTIVAKPSENSSLLCNEVAVTDSQSDKYIIFYPALARVFKNFELLLDALAYLKINNPLVFNKIELILTLNHEGGRYERDLYAKYKHLGNVKFVGMLSRKEVDKNYINCDVVAFPSMLETWGLPITEAKDKNKPIILPDLAYAYETLGSYHSAAFINPHDPIALSDLFDKLVNKTMVFDKVVFNDPDDICYSWNELVNKIVSISK